MRVVKRGLNEEGWRMGEKDMPATRAGLRAVVNVDLDMITQWSTGLITCWDFTKTSTAVKPVLIVCSKSLEEEMKQRSSRFERWLSGSPETSLIYSIGRVREFPHPHQRTKNKPNTNT